MVISERMKHCDDQLYLRIDEKKIYKPKKAILIVPRRVDLDM